jgi:hypothetical protein
MNTHKIDVKIFTHGAQPPLSELVPVFHTWIQQQRVADELLIDVANYAHVPDGPGVMLIGHEGNYSLDLMGGEAGVLYSQRRPRGALDFSQALTRAVRQALLACSLLEAESALSRAVRVQTDRWLVRINDRLHAPNEAATWERVQPAARAALARVLGEDVALEPAAYGRELFGFHVRHAVKQSVADLLGRAS